MNNDFPRLLALLRKERGLSQKAAAESLGVSQALLSHYEKGIRECGLDFICRAARFYGVTADYLLGLSPERGNEAAPEADAPPPDEVKRFRGSVMAPLGRIITCHGVTVLFDLAMELGYRDFAAEFQNYMALAVYKLFRYFYRANPSNPEDFFRLRENDFPESVNAAMLLCEARLRALRDTTAAELKAPGVERKQTINHEIIAGRFPQGAQAMLNILSTAEKQADFT